MSLRSLSRRRVEIELEKSHGIFDALTAAVAGLQAQSFALQNISGNIANSQTTGYKETNTAFQDLVNQAAINLRTPDGVTASSVATNTVQGSITSTSVATDMAINGDGFSSSPSRRALSIISRPSPASMTIRAPAISP